MPPWTHRFRCITEYIAEQKGYRAGSASPLAWGYATREPIAEGYASRESEFVEPDQPRYSRERELKPTVSINFSSAHEKNRL